MPLARFAWLVLAYNVAVINWGAYVRATGSGAGCGSHWPLCNGQMVPRAPAVATIIEFSHRLSSGVALIAVALLAVWVFRECVRGHPARLAAALSLLLILTEAAVGAGLVLFQLVADNATMARAMFVAVHLLNTFFLLAALTATAWWTSTGGRVETRGKAPAIWSITAGAAILLLAGASGAVAALGDTLFPAMSLSEGIFADLSASSHVLMRLRVLHPFVAVCAAGTIVMLSARLARRTGGGAARWGRAVGGLALTQVGLGFLNVVLLAPVWLQMVHLFVADLIWTGFVVLGVQAITAAVPVNVEAGAGASTRAAEGSPLVARADTVIR